MVDIVSLQKMVLYWIHLRSINMSSALIFHLQKTFPMSIFDFQVHLCADGALPTCCHTIAKTHTFLPLDPAFTRARPPLGISVFQSCKGPPGEPIKGAAESLVRRPYSFQGADFCPWSFFLLCRQKKIFFLFLRISLFVLTRCFPSYEGLYYRLSHWLQSHFKNEVEIFLRVWFLRKSK